MAGRAQSLQVNGSRSKILNDLIKSTPGDEGKWFATAKSVGQLSLALNLAFQSPCDPKTLNRAARDFMEKEPKFSLGVAMASLNWLSKGMGYEVTGHDVISAYNHAVKAGEILGMSKQVRKDIKKIVTNDTSPGMFVKSILESMIKNE